MTDKEADQKAEQRLNKIYQLKKKLFEKRGLSNIDPADDGLWQGDIVLTTEQVDQMLQSLDSPKPLRKTPEGLRPKRSAATFFEMKPYLRWTMPISYWVSPAFSATERSTIDAAMSTISSSTGCIKFAKSSTRLSSGSQIQFVKLAQSSCFGSSPVGYQGINTVNIATTSWCNGNALKGMVMHEVIHSLGGNHEQSRTDRDDYVEILWDNIDSQQWYNFEISDDSTSYGLPYGYTSVMHYEQGSFQVQPGLDTIYPYQDTVLGGNYLTSGDILQLKRMYCRPTACADSYQECGTWAIEQWCPDAEWGSWMKSYCAKSCGAC